MSSTIKDMGNKESIKQAQQNPGDMNLMHDGDVKPSASVRGCDKYAPNLQRVQKINTSQSAQIKGPSQSSIQGDKNRPDVHHLQQLPSNMSLSNSFTQEIVSHSRENFLQNYASLPQPVFSSPGYVNGNSVFSGQMIPPMVVQQPMQMPALSGMFQTGLMYQTLTPGSGKPNHVNSPFFPPFTKGSLIMLATGNLKPIEELKTVDFIESAKVSKELCLETSKIAKIQDLPNSAMSLIEFAVENFESEVLVEKPSEYPFFIYEQGWASCKPDMTLSRYGLACRQLKVGDVCIFLSNKQEMRPEKTTDRETKSNINTANQGNTALVSQAPAPNNVSRMTESGENILVYENDIKTRPKSFVKREKDESLGFGQLQPAVKKAKVDIPSTTTV